MAIYKDKYEEQLLNFNNACSEAGVKITHQRREIFRAVAASKEHPDAEYIYKKVKMRIPEISLDTVYRTLWMLHDLGLLQTVGMASERMRFDANMRKHHHFVCKSCGLTRDFYSEELDRLEIPEQVKDFGRIDATQVEVRGLCLKCSQKQKLSTRASRKKETQ